MHQTICGQEAFTFVTARGARTAATSISLSAAPGFLRAPTIRRYFWIFGRPFEATGRREASRVARLASAGREALRVCGLQGARAARRRASRVSGLQGARAAEAPGQVATSLYLGAHGMGMATGRETRRPHASRS